MPARDIIVDMDSWKVLTGVLLVGFAFFVYRRTFPPIPTARRILLGTLRTCAFLSLVLFLLAPAIVETALERIVPTVIVLVDCSRSMSIDDCGGMSRIVCAHGAVGELREALAERDDAEVIVMPFSGATAVMEEEGVLRADGEGTDIVGTLQEAERAHRHLNLAGIVLLSDGRITRGMLEPQIELTVPVFAVGLGDTVGPPDVKIEDLLFDRVTYTGSETAIEAVISASGHQGRDITVRLLEESNELDRVRVSAGGDREKRSVELEFRPDRPGMKRLTVEATPVPGEEWTGNNSEVIGIRVLKERIRILYVDRFADWNTTFFMDLMRRTERFEMTAVTWRKDLGYTELPGYGAYEFSGGTGAFARYDLLVISDDEELLSDPSIARAIIRYVEEGGALLLVADEHSPLAAPGGLDGLAGLLPVVQSGPPRIESGEYYVSVPPGGIDHPLASSFSGLEPPPLPGRVGGIELSSAATAPLVMADSRGAYPFLAIQRSGGGITAAVLGFPLWRWKLTGTEPPGAYETLLGGLFQYLVEGGRTLPIELTSARSVYRMGERIVLNLYAREGTDLERIKGEIRSGSKEGEIVATHLYRRGGEGYANAMVGPFPPGEYRAIVSTNSTDGSVYEASAAFSVLPVSTEFLDISRDMDLLRHLARISGGLTVERGDVGGVAELLDLEAAVTERKRTIELRESSLLLIVTLLFLTAEWVLRKLWGLI
jgi:hypothetical protein